MELIQRRKEVLAANTLVDAVRRHRVRVEVSRLYHDAESVEVWDESPCEFREDVTPITCQLENQKLQVQLTRASLHVGGQPTLCRLSIQLAPRGF